MKKSISEKIISLLFPEKCLVCAEMTGGANIPLCPSCMKKYAEEKKAVCTECGKNASECRCGEKIHVYTPRFYFPSDNENGKLAATRKLILSCKEKKNSTVEKLFANEICRVLLSSDVRENIQPSENSVVTYIPRSKKNLRKYGFDQSGLMAEYISEILRIEKKDYLVRDGGRTQKSLDYGTRAVNAEKSLYINGDYVGDIRGKTIIVADDIVTSGATFLTASQLLYDFGAERVICTAYARTNGRIREYRENGDSNNGNT